MSDSMEIGTLPTLEDVLIEASDDAQGGYYESSKCWALIAIALALRDREDRIA